MILDLTNPENSELKFKINKFPDGQKSITLENFLHDEKAIIKSRLNSFMDLELIICANQCIKSFDKVLIDLYVPYFLGARSDRKFDSYGINYLKQVICPIINSQKFNKVTVVDPHSDVLEGCLDNFQKLNNFNLVDYALPQIDNNYQNNICLVSPDAGAFKKIFDVAKYFNIDKLVTAAKVRDLKTSQIIKTEITNLPIRIFGEELKYVIVDDICDGGRTFIELAKSIKQQRPNAKVYLIVTHGIFSAGLYELSKHIDGIFSTNSVKDIDAESYSDYIVNKDYLKQLNVFRK